MSQTAVLVWISAAELLPAFSADLEAFARARLLLWEAPKSNALASVRTSAYAPDVVDEIEESLEQARTRTASLDQAAAVSALSRADSLLHEHPELPQAAWLMAERLELGADLEASLAGGSDAAAELRARALALEGMRAAPFSDRAQLQTAPPLPRPALQVEGLEPEDILEWNGTPRARSFDAHPGEYHVRVLRSSRLIWAGWVSVGARDTHIQLPIPATVACSTDDLAGAHFTPTHAVPPAHARCTSYALARARSNVDFSAGIEVAFCEGAHCGQTVIWERPRPRATATARPWWPTWASYAAAGAGILAGTGAVLFFSGAFNRPEPRTTTTWVYTGLNAQTRF